MKKMLTLTLLGGVTLVLTGCRNPFSDTEVLTENQVQQEQDLSSNAQLSMTTQVIKDYLANANKNIQDQEVVLGDTIIVDYIGRLNDSEVFDTSVETIAQAAEKFNPNRDYSAGLEFTVGSGMVIPGFDAGVVGMKLGETKTLHIPADQAYGPINPEQIVRIPRESMGDTSTFEVGQTLYMQTPQGPIPVRITDMTDTEVEIDANMELAGKDLIFDVTIKEIKK